MRTPQWPCMDVRPQEAGRSLSFVLSLGSAEGLPSDEPRSCLYIRKGHLIALRTRRMATLRSRKQQVLAKKWRLWAPRVVLVAASGKWPVSTSQTYTWNRHRVADRTSRSAPRNRGHTGVCRQVFRTGLFIRSNRWAPPSAHGQSHGRAP